MDTELKQKTKNNFQKNFFKLMNNVVFGETMENVRKHRNIKLVSRERYQSQSIRTKLSYYKIFYRKFISNRNEITMNKPVYLGLSILDLSKTVVYEFRYDYVKPNYGKNAKLCHMDTDIFTVHIKTDDIYILMKQMTF